MFRSIRSWQLFLAVGGLCAISLAGMYWWNLRRSAGNDHLFRRLPVERAIIAGVDVKALRAAGVLDLLAGARGVEELDYKEFVQQTGFDYREDLDYVAAAFDAEHKYFLLRGRFDWGLLTRFSAAKGAACTNLFCSLRGDEPGKNLSYFPLSRDVLALAIGFAPRAAYSLMNEREPESGFQIPQDAIWASLPGPLLAASKNLPDGVKAYAATLSSAERVTIGLAVGATGIEARLQADCTAAPAAAELRDRLQDLTELLRKMLARAGQQPKPGELAAVLLTGRFEANGKALRATWPVPRAFLANLASETP